MKINEGPPGAPQGTTGTSGDSQGSLGEPWGRRTERSLLDSISIETEPCTLVDSTKIKGGASLHMLMESSSVTLRKKVIPSQVQNHRYIF